MEQDNYIVDPDIASSWVNHPAPYLDPYFVTELNKIGGFDTLTGKPNLRFVWGQTEKKWFGGRWRTKYVADGVPAQLVGNSYEHIGRPCWIVEQYFPASVVGVTPEQWEMYRYKDWENKDIGFVKDCDMLGEYPYEGRYEFCLEVGKPSGKFTPSGRPVLSYMPINNAVFEELKAKLYQREHAEKPSVSEEVQVADRVKALEERNAKAYKEKFAKRNEMARDIYNAIVGNKLFRKGKNVRTT